MALLKYNSTMVGTFWYGPASKRKYRVPSTGIIDVFEEDVPGLLDLTEYNRPLFVRYTPDSDPVPAAPIPVPPRGMTPIQGKAKAKAPVAAPEETPADTGATDSTQTAATETDAAAAADVAADADKPPADTASKKATGKK